MFTMLLVVFVDLLGFGIVIPLLPFYGEHFGASPFADTMLLATYSGLQLFSSPFWGRFSDRVGRRPVIMISLATSIIAYLWLSHANALWMLFGARALQGFSAGNISVTQAYVADVTTPENRSRGMGYMGAAFGLGFIIGPAIGGYLAGSSPTAFSVALPAYVAASMSLLALAIAAVTLKESLPQDRRASHEQISRLKVFADAFRRPRLRLLMTMFFISTFAFAGMETTFALFVYDRLRWGPKAVGEIFALVGVVLVLVQGGLTGRMAKRFGEPRLILAGTVAIAFGLLLLGLSYTAWPLIFASCLLAFGSALSQPATSSLVSQEAGVLEQGSILGVNQSVSSLARLVGPAAAGAVFAIGGPGAPYLAGTAMMLFAVWLAAKLIRLFAGDRSSSAFDEDAGESLRHIRDTARIR